MRARERTEKVLGRIVAQRFGHDELLLMSRALDELILESAKTILSHLDFNDHPREVRYERGRLREMYWLQEQLRGLREKKLIKKRRGK